MNFSNGLDDIRKMSGLPKKESSTPTEVSWQDRTLLLIKRVWYKVRRPGSQESKGVWDSEQKREETEEEEEQEEKEEETRLLWG